MPSLIPAEEALSRMGCAFGGHFATAEGYLGASAQYLENVVAGLGELGICDATLLVVHQRVTALREGRSRN